MNALETDKNQSNNNDRLLVIETDTTQQTSSPPPLITTMSSSNHINTNDKKVKILFILLGLLLAIGIAIVVTLMKPNNQQLVSTEQTTQLSALINKFSQPTTGEIWLSEPRPIDHQGFFTSDETTSYFIVGEHEDRKIIMAENSSMIHEPIRLFEKNDKGETRLLVTPQSSRRYTQDDIDAIKKGIAESVRFDYSTTFDSLSIPDDLSLPNKEKLIRYDPAGLGRHFVNDTEEYTRKEIASYGATKLFRIENYDQTTHLTQLYYELFLPIKTRVSLIYQPHDIHLGKYLWKNEIRAGHSAAENVFTYDYLRPLMINCTSAIGFVMYDASPNDSNFIEAGTTADHKTVYHTSDPNALLVKQVYDYYLESAETYPAEPIPYSEFFNHHGVVMIKNASNESILYARNDFLPVTGCHN